MDSEYPVLAPEWSIVFFPIVTLFGKVGAAAQGDAEIRWPVVSGFCVSPTRLGLKGERDRALVLVSFPESGSGLLAIDDHSKIVDPAPGYDIGPALGYKGGGFLRPDDVRELGCARTTLLPILDSDLRR